MLAIPNCKKNEKLLNASPGLRQRFAQDDAAAFVIPSGAKGASAFNLNGISASRSTGACDVEITRAATAEKQALTGPSG